MQPISKTRITIVLIVTVLSLLLTYPTARYYMFLQGEAPKPTAPKPEMKTPPPAKSNAVEYANWAKANPEAAQWLDKNQAYVAYEAKSEKLRQSAIPLGLDLIGGVDVTLVLDRDKAVANEVNNTIDSLQDRFKVNKIGATFEPRANGFTVKLADKADAQKAANEIKMYLGQRALRLPAASDLEKGQSVLVELNPAELNRTIKGDIEGAKKGISDRVDQLGVTQPRVNIQGEDRIRVQVPGEKDPDRLLNNVIRPAILEFRLVDPRNNEVIGQDGKVKPGVLVPPGTEVLPAMHGEMNNKTQQMEYTHYSILVSKKAELTGKDLRRAYVQIFNEDINNPIHVDLEFNDEGARKFAEVTGANVGRQLAIVLDGVVRSHPNLNEKIGEGRATISGGFSYEEATDLSQILKAGSLKAPMKIESKRTVGATLGAASIKSGVSALLWGSVAIIAMMVLYYGTAGVIAVLALILNVLIILGLMAISRATLTLSGIGGILLTVGMAVDANILIYERMREELRSGKPMKQALALGFHRAFAVILDSNVTTLLSALVLLQFTEGSVFGFALTMTYGLVANLFTGLTVTYTLCGLWFQKFGHLSLGKVAIFTNTAIDFIKMRFLSWGLSSGIGVLALIAVIATGGLESRYGVDFAGGYRAEVQFNQKLDEEKLRGALIGAGLKDPNIQSVTNEKNYYIIDTKLVGKEVAPTQAKFEQAMKQAYPSGGYEVKASSGFGAQTSQEFKSLAIWVTILASGAILIYLWFRFELVFGVAAVVSLLHDLLIVFLLACLWGVQVNLEVIAAMMVLMGFSVNDTIVIFDRIRENVQTMPGKSFRELCNLAMNQSLSRTVLTSGTVLIAAMCLFFIGGEGLQAFAKIYVIGVIFGTYSSDFIAAPILYQWNKHRNDQVRLLLATPKKKKEMAKPIRQNA